jgi:hypothetical protein
LHLDPPQKVIRLGTLPTRLVIPVERPEEDIENDIHQRLAFVAGEPPRIYSVAREWNELRRFLLDDLDEASVLSCRERLGRRIHERKATTTAAALRLAVWIRCLGDV